LALQILLFIVGLLLLTAGADALNRGSCALSLSLGIRPIVVGLTVLAFGTSCPEMVVSLVALFKKGAGTPVSFGNILGSNIANLALILGTAALVRPLKVVKATLRREMPIAVASALLLAVLAFLGRGLSRVDGIVLLAAFAAFLVYCLKTARNGDSVDGVDEFKMTAASKARNVVLIVGGLVALIGGAQLMVSSAVFVARRFGVSSFVIGVTVIALGTSLPELAASVVASARGNAELSVGNVVGSNIFNSLLILGIVAVIRPIAVGPELFRFQIPAMILFTVIVLPLMYTGMKLSRWEGVMLLAAYGAFVYCNFAGG